MNTLELVLKFGRRLLAFFLDFFVGYPSPICWHPPSVLWKFGTWWLTIWLSMMWVLSPPLFFLNLWYLLWLGLFSFWVPLWFFRCLQILRLDVRGMQSVSGLWRWMAVRYCLNNDTSLPFWSQIFISQILFPYFCSVAKFACWIFSLHLLKERKRRRFPLLTMLVALLVILSWRLIPIFQHGDLSSVNKPFSMALNRPEHTLNVPWPDPVCSCIFISLSLFLLGLLNGSWFGRFVLQVDVDLVEESMQMIGGLQLLARTQSSQYVLNEVSWVCNDAFWVSLA